MASAGLNRLPVSSTSVSAVEMPSIRTVRVTPPPPGSSPSETSGTPRSTLGSSTTIRWWQASVISRPPPSAAPLTAATTGLPSVSRRRSCALTASAIAKISGASSGPAWIILCRLPPAKNVFFALVTTTPTISSFSASSRSIAVPMDCRYRSFMVLALEVGSSRVSTTMLSASRSYRTALWVACSVMCSRVLSWSGKVRCARRWWRYPCRHRRRGWPGRTSGPAARARRRGCRGSSPRSPRAGDPSRSHRR